LIPARGTVAFVGMSNVLSEEKKQQVVALGRLGWPLRRIEQETGVRRETAGAYLKAAGIGVRPPGAWGRRPPAKPANEVTTGSDATKPANTVNPNPENLSSKGTAKAETSKPANKNGSAVTASSYPRQPLRLFVSPKWSRRSQRPRGRSECHLVIPYAWFPWPGKGRRWPLGFRPEGTAMSRNLGGSP
jgi:hypothetical protein